ncbi:hypothetical protein V8G54_009513 [Vigna mungo]|uniref:Transposase MuDR plant domain-containing protein n=1 Tax=Vigna mungo TaxID=3915 RepID=A0AAQ3S5I9_VIGMU
MEKSNWTSVMGWDGLRPDQYIFASVLSVCAALAALESRSQAHWDTNSIRALKLRHWSLDVNREVVLRLRQVLRVVRVEVDGRCRILLCVMGDIEVVIHHGGKFANDGCLKYEGENDTMLFYPNVWSYFVVLSVVKSFGYNGFKELWFSVGCGPVLDDRLEPLSDDVGGMHMVNLAHLNGQVHLYVMHIVSEAEVIHMIEYNVDEGGDEVAPQVNECGEGAQVAEGMDDGVRQQLDEGVGGHGQRVEVVFGEDQMTKAFENEGERTEALDGDRIDVEEVDAEEVMVEEAVEVQVEEADAEEVVVEEADEVHEAGEGEGSVEAERIEEGPVEGDRLDGEAYTIEVEDLEVEDLEDIEVEVRDWSTSRDGDDGEMNSDDGLVDINVQCDVPDNDTEMEVEVEPLLPGSESDSEEDEIDDSSWFNDECDEENEDEEGYGHFSTFTMPKKMVDFNWEVGTYFADKHDILDAIKSYGVENGKNLKIVKNDRKRIRVKCLGSKGECPWVTYFGFMDAVKSWQLRTMVDRHTCSREHKLWLLNAKWLSRKLEKTIRENPNVKGVDIRDKFTRKWNIAISKNMAYKAKAHASDEVAGSFIKQYSRIYDYAHELLVGVAPHANLMCIKNAV